MIARARILANPFVAGGAAVLVVLTGLALASSQLTIRTPMSVGTMEQVSVTKHVMVAPAAQAAQTAHNAPQIARTGKIDLYVDDVRKVAAIIGSIARRNGGDVFSSDLTDADGTQGGTGHMQIRVPANRFEASMAAVSQSGKVRESSTNAEDVTDDITDSDARLRNLRQTEADIRRIMDRSGNVSQIMDAENQLSQVREQIETLESELKSMRGRVAYSTIDVDLQAQVNTAPVQPTAAAQLSSAWQSALGALGQLTIGLVALVLWIAVFLPYIAAAAVLGWLLYRRVQRA